MLTPEAIKAVNEFVYKQPRSIKEIGELLKCSWVTADKYVSHIIDKYGTIKLKVFRGGTKGALKIVYWAQLEGVTASTAQHIILEKIKGSRKKQDFSPFDIYSLVEENKKQMSIDEHSLTDLMKGASKQLFIFSGNMSFINEIENGKKIIDVLGDLARKRINIKILSRLDVASIKNVKQIQHLNHLLGYDAIEVKHIEQPLRGFIVDSNLLRLIEEKKKSEFKGNELDKDVTISYHIHDRDWIEWMEKVFFNLHSNSLPIENRIKDLEKFETLLLK
jgi:hypothetical protein